MTSRRRPAPPAVAVVPDLTLRPPATDGPTARRIPVEVYAPEPTPFDQLQSIIGIIIAPLATTGLVILFVLFLLMRREDVRDRAIRLVGTHDLERSTSAMDDAGYRLGRYFLTLTAINAAFGVIIGLGLWMIGVPSPILWGVLAMLMRFVPFIGSIIAAAFPLLLAASVDPGWSMFLMTLALYVISEPIMGNVVEPIVQGQSTGLSPLAIILSAAFWTLLWGPIGLLLAIPLTVVLVVLGRHVERLEFLSVLLGDTPPLSPPERFYQRMLAGDPAEAVEQAERMIKERPLIEYYDDVVIEGLRLAQADADREALDAERLPDLRETAAVVIDTLSDYDFLPRKPAKPGAEGSNNGGARRRRRQRHPSPKRKRSTTQRCSTRPLSIPIGAAPAQFSASAPAPRSTIPPPSCSLSFSTSAGSAPPSSVRARSSTARCRRKKSRACASSACPRSMPRSAARIRASSCGG